MEPKAHLLANVAQPTKGTDLVFKFDAKSRWLAISVQSSVQKLDTQDALDFDDRLILERGEAEQKDLVEEPRLATLEYPNN